jgi:hypothetical protein
MQRDSGRRRISAVAHSESRTRIFDVQKRILTNRCLLTEECLLDVTMLMPSLCLCHHDTFIAPKMGNEKR